MKNDQYYQLFKNICTLAEILNNLEHHDLQNHFYHENNLKQLLVIFILSCSAFNSGFVDNIATFFFLSKSALFMNPAIANLSVNPFCFIFASSV